MDERDQQNLAFLRSLTKAQFDRWIRQLSIEDVEYALELLQREQTRMVVLEMEVSDNVEDLTQAQQIIKRIRSV